VADSNERFKKHYEAMSANSKRVMVWIPKKGFNAHQRKLEAMAEAEGWHYKPRAGK